MKDTLEAFLELEEHIGYPKHAAEGRQSGNSRNGVSSKTVRGDFGVAFQSLPALAIPRVTASMAGHIVFWIA